MSSQSVGDERRYRSYVPTRRADAWPGRLQLEAHPHFGAAAVALVDLEGGGHLGDQRQAQPEARAVWSRAHPAALVGDGDPQLAVVEPGVDAHLAWLRLVGVGVHDGVGRRLGDRQADRGDDLL